MTKITEIMNLIEFPVEAVEFFDEVYTKIENDASLMAKLCTLEELYYEKFNCEELENALTDLSQASGYHKYTIDMLLAVYACIRLRGMYAEKGYSEEFFAHNMKDLTYKLHECKKLHDMWGSFVFEWFAGFYKMERFALGRLQYNPKAIAMDYKELKKATWLQPFTFLRAVLLHLNLFRNHSKWHTNSSVPTTVTDTFSFAIHGFFIPKHATFIPKTAT